MCVQVRPLKKVSFVSFPQVIILIGNKADLEAQRDVTYEEAKQFAEENGERLLRLKMELSSRPPSLLSSPNII